MTTIPKDTAACFVPDNLTSPIEGAPEGPLAGLTFALKDLFDVAGHRTSNGNPDFHAWTPPAERHAEVVDRLLGAGATLVGMTICDEFFYSLNGDNAHYGTPKNAKAPGRLPGGSSSGSAAAVAAGMVEFAIGSDTGGSVRIPASFCGIWGIRPTHGRVSLQGARAMAPDFDTAGWFTNDGDLLAKIGPVLLDGKAESGKVRRVLVADDAVARTDGPLAAAFEKWVEDRVDRLPDRGHAVVAPDGDGLEGWWLAFRAIQASQVRETNLPWVRAHNATLGPGIKERFEMAETIAEDEVARARATRTAARQRLDALVTPGTLLALPTGPCIAPRLDAQGPDLESFRANTMALTCIAGLAGLPQVSIPGLTVDGCPAGVSLIGWRGSDEVLLDFAASIGG